MTIGKRISLVRHKLDSNTLEGNRVMLQGERRKWEEKNIIALYQGGIEKQS